MHISIDSLPFDSLAGLEYLETNGLGGWSSSTVIGLNTRRYHGVLVAATRPPVERMVLLSRLDETFVVAGARVECATREFPGAVHPEGYRSIAAFRRGAVPEWELAAGSLRVRKQLAALHRRNAVVITYLLEEGPDEVVLELRPFFACRDYHALTRANGWARHEAEAAADCVRYTMYDGTPTIYLTAPGITFERGPDWYYRFRYRVEEERGLDGEEDLFTPGVMKVMLRRGRPLTVAAATDQLAPHDAAQWFEAELQRREAVCARVSGATSERKRLLLAADQFIVSRSLPSGADGKTVIAGYHWFTDWGRDTMIALPGLCLETGRAADAREILDQFAAYVSEGMVPNRFADGADAPEYNTVDASLWFFVAVLRYVDATGDIEPLRERWVARLDEILLRYREGTRFGIRADRDGLLLAGDETTQLTWMDAKVGDWVVTPRFGKTVEINALWVNAHLILGSLKRRLGDEEVARALAEQGERLKLRYLELFWDEGSGGLVDCIHGEAIDRSVRPNQIYALSLPYPLLEGVRAERLLALVRARLLTPLGLRSLDPESPEYRGVYRGDMRARDGAYHQGTVWSFLIGAYIDALIHVRGAAGREEGEAALTGLRAHLDDGCIGSISEIFDGDPPHAPRGCVAQAWGVAELLRAIGVLERAGTPAR